MVKVVRRVVCSLCVCCRDAKDIDTNAADVASVTATSSLEVIADILKLFASCATKLLSLLDTARRYASAVLAVIVCLSVCQFACLLHASIVSKWLNVGSHKQCHTIASAPGL